MSLECCTAHVTHAIAISLSDIRSSNPAVNLFFDNLSHSIVERRTIGKVGNPGK
jgi:hypothetical protein